MIESRRWFLKFMVGAMAGLSNGLALFPSFARLALAETKRIIVPKGTKREDLAGENPANLDTRNLEITPLKDFGTMGQTDYKADLETWRLKITGSVENPLSLRYDEILALPAVEKDVLLICPGFFANYGKWKGVSFKVLFDKARVMDGATRIIVRGPKEAYATSRSFPIKDALKGKVFLAYQVNGEPLPMQHGYPLRTVAEGYFGSAWVKYVYQVIVQKT